MRVVVYAGESAGEGSYCTFGEERMAGFRGQAKLRPTHPDEWEEAEGPTRYAPWKINPGLDTTMYFC